MTTVRVHPQVKVNHSELQRQLYLLEVQIWQVQQDLKKVAAVGTYLTPSPPFALAGACLQQAHDCVGKIRQALRNTEGS